MIVCTDKTNGKLECVRCMEWTTILLVLVLAVFMLGCCGSIFRRRKKDTSKDKDHDDTHKGCH